MKKKFLCRYLYRCQCLSNRLSAMQNKLMLFVGKKICMQNFKHATSKALLQPRSKSVKEDYHYNYLVSLFCIVPFEVSFKVFSSVELGRCPVWACFQHNYGEISVQSHESWRFMVCFNRPPPCSQLSYLSALLYIRPNVYFLFCFVFGCVLMCITVVLLIMQKMEKKINCSQKIQKHPSKDVYSNILHRLEIDFLIRLLFFPYKVWKSTEDAKFWFIGHALAP